MTGTESNGSTPTRTPDDDSRGQLLLAAGVLVAGLLIVMVAVLNAGIFTSTAATLDRGDETGDAQAFMSAASEDVRLLYDESEGDERFLDNLTVLEREYNQLYRSENADIIIEPESENPERGWTVLQQDVDGFTDESATASGGGAGSGLGHAVIRQADDPDMFVVEFVPDELVSRSDDHFEITVRAQGGGPDVTETISFYQLAGEAVVEDHEGNRVSFDIDREENVTVDLLEGTAEGQDDLEWPLDGVDRDRVSIFFDNEDNVTGSWVVITRGPDGETEPGPPGNFRTVGEDPDQNLETYEGFVPFDVSVRYRTHELEIERTVELSPLSGLFGD